MSVECNTCLGSASTVVPPRIYEGLTVKVFNANYYVLATSGIDKAKYKVEKDRTFFAPDTNVFRNDLKVVSPKARSKVDASNIEVK